MVEDIRDHGAAVDGSTDDTDAINSAVDAAAPDGTVYLPEGDILMGSNSRMPVVLSEDEGGLTIEGAGPAKTNLLMAGGKTDSHFGIYVDPSSGSSISGLRFRNFTLDGQGLEQDYSIGLGIKVTDDGSGPQPVEIRDCVVKDWAVNGIVFEAPGGRVYNSSIVKNGRKREQETGLDGHGLNCDVGDSGTVVADGCLFQDNTGAGADNGSGTLRIRNSVIDRCGYAVKINQDSVEQSVENTLISNIQTEPGIYNIPANTASADLVLNSVVLDTVEMAGVDLPAPEPLAPFEDPEPDTPDALVHLASDHASAVLAAEEALRGERETVNGVDAAPLPDALTVADRRTGFVGAGLPAEHDDPDGVPGDAVPDESPLFMGFKSGFSGNQASEDRVTISEGPFAGGSTQHLSKIHLDLEQWYEQDDREDRVAKMFCPAHASEGRVEGVGDNLGSDSGMGECPVAHDDAREEGTVGHSQKMTDVREDDSPIILRRDFNTTGDGRPGVHFLSLQRDVGDFVATREAMNATALAEETGVGQRSNNGILQYMTVERRGNFLLPPRSLRALPPARP